MVAYNLTAAEKWFRDHEGDWMLCVWGDKEKKVNSLAEARKFYKENNI